MPVFHRQKHVSRLNPVVVGTGMSGTFGNDEECNQSPPYVDVDLYTSDLPLQRAVAANGGSEDSAALAAFGRRWGAADMFGLGRQANENPPKLRAFDPNGFRLD